MLVAGPILGALLGYYAGILLIPHDPAHLHPLQRVEVALWAGFGLVFGTSLSVGLIAATISRKNRKS